MPSSWCTVIETLTVSNAATYPPATRRTRAPPCNIYTRTLEQQTPHPFRRIAKIWSIHRIGSALHEIRLMRPAIFVDESLPELVDFLLDTSDTRRRNKEPLKLIKTLVHSVVL